MMLNLTDMTRDYSHGSTTVATLFELSGEIRLVLCRSEIGDVHETEPMVKQEAQLRTSRITRTFQTVSKSWQTVGSPRSQIRTRM
jgi:hypothetical protein